MFAHVVAPAQRLQGEAGSDRTLTVAGVGIGRPVNVVTTDMVAPGFLVIGSGPAGVSAAETFAAGTAISPSHPVGGSGAALRQAAPEQGLSTRAPGQPRSPQRRLVRPQRRRPHPRGERRAHRRRRAGSDHRRRCALPVLAPGARLRFGRRATRRDRRAPRHPARRCGGPNDARRPRRHRRTHAHIGPNIYAAGDITFAHNVAAGRPVISEHWRDAAQQCLVAGLTAAGCPAAWDKISVFSCAIGKFTLRYRGWSAPHDSCRLAERRDGFSATYQAGGSVVGTLDATASPAS